MAGLDLPRAQKVLILPRGTALTLGGAQQSKGNRTLPCACQSFQPIPFQKIPLVPEILRQDQCETQMEPSERL